MSTTIIGADFSGARSDSNTWCARGQLDGDGTLYLDSVQRIRRDELGDLLPQIPTPAVGALDFPFGVPRRFAERLGAVSPCRAMPDLWDVVAAMGLDDFIGQRNRFVAENGEPRRAGDLKYHRESYSPLHNVNPNMLPHDLPRHRVCCIVGIWGSPAAGTFLPCRPAVLRPRPSHCWS